MLASMCDVIRHRGPDDSGVHIDGSLGLGNRRLSIIDVAGGHQPISTPDGTKWIVYNGELYNYRELRSELEPNGYAFQTQSDTEVVLAAYETWGVDCVRHFNGIFGFAIWDAPKRRLFLARDHLGVKPLYYYDGPGEFVFGSEVKALLACPQVPRELDPTALDQYLTYRYVPSPRTMFAGIFKLPPGHRLVYDGREARIDRYWRREPSAPWQGSEDDAVTELRTLLQRAVKRQMISDVTVGAFLSGGLDSSLIVALMSKETDQPVKTFSVGFTGAKGEADELPFARSIAAQLGAEHYEMIVDPSNYWSQLPKMIWHLEEPNGTVSTLAQYSISDLASRHVKVALSGQGADELFAGYRRYIGERWSAAYRRLPDIAKKAVVPRLAEWLGRPTLKRAARALPMDDMLQRFAETYAVFEEDEKHQLYGDRLQTERAGADDLWAPLAYWTDGMPGDDALAKMLYMDTRVWLPDELLTYGDKMCMATSLEMRVPFLDVELVEFLERIPSHMKLKGLTGKHILKKAAEAFLPRSVIYRKKQGFPVPILEWFRSDLNHRVAELLLAPDSACSQYFSTDYLTALLAAYRDGKIRDHRKLYCLVSFELWYQLFILTSDVELAV